MALEVLAAAQAVATEPEMALAPEVVMVQEAAAAHPGHPMRGRHATNLHASRRKLCARVTGRERLCNSRGAADLDVAQVLAMIPLRFCKAWVASRAVAAS